MLACVAASPALAESLRFDRDAVASGESWRVATAVFAHYTPAHFAGNALACALPAWWIERHSRSDLARTLALALLASALLLANAPRELAQFAGASGVAIALAVFAVTRGISESRGRERFAWSAFLAFVLAKLAAESIAGFALTSGAEYTLWPPSHWAGALAGAISALSPSSSGSSHPGCSSRPSSPRER